MLAENQLTDLYRAHRREDVLSVYVDADQRDFGQRAKWRLALKNRLAAERRRAHDPAGFDEAFARLSGRLSTDNGFIEGRGWAGFATPDECIYAEALPVPMPNLVRWEPGLRVAPYARALKQCRPVIVVLIDCRTAALHRYRMGVLTGGERLQADAQPGAPGDVRAAKRASEHSGVRGKTASDAAQRLLEVERDRLIARASEVVRSEAAPDGIVVVGGSERVAVALCNALADLGRHRVVAQSGWTLEMSAAELRARVEHAASEITAADQVRMVSSLTDGARAGGNACVGQDDVERALLEKRVRTLVVSDTLREGLPDRADHLEGAAFEQGASVVELSRGAAALLDREAEGVGAVLRYRVVRNGW